MSEAKQPEPFEKHRVPQQKVEYLPPDPASIRDYARAVCNELAQQNPTYSRSEVILGFTSFVSFIAERTAKYLSTEHKDFLLKGYPKSAATKKVRRTRCLQKSQPTK